MVGTAAVVSFNLHHSDTWLRVGERYAWYYCHYHCCHIQGEANYENRTVWLEGREVEIEGEGGSKEREEA